MDVQHKPSTFDPEAFLAHYYRTLDTVELHPELPKFFRKDSRMQFNGVEFLGTEDIVARLVPADLHTIVHILKKQDYQPLSRGEYLISVLGVVTVDGGAEIKFSTIFVVDNNGPHYFIKYQIIQSNIFAA